jgi:hypothetical protein
MEECNAEMSRITNERDAAVRRERADKDELSALISILRGKVDNREAALRAVGEQRDTLLAEREKMKNERHDAGREVDEGGAWLKERDDRLRIASQLKVCETERDMIATEKAELQVHHPCMPMPMRSKHSDP